MSREKVLFNWSSGKDSALALHRLLQEDQYEVSLLLTTVSETYRRISQHGVRIELLEKQAQSLGIPLRKVWLPKELTMEQYGRIMREALSDIRKEGIGKAAFGDIFLEDLRNYREEKMQEAGYEALFPIWNMDTRQLAGEVVDLGFRAKVVCVNSRYLDRSFVGKEYDSDFLDSLPETVDPCGEHGEFHTFVYDGPIFGKPIPVETGEIVFRNLPAEKSKPAGSSDNYTCSTADHPAADKGLWFCDLLIN